MYKNIKEKKSVSIVLLLTTKNTNFGNEKIRHHWGGPKDFRVTAYNPKKSCDRGGCRWYIPLSLSVCDVEKSDYFS